MAASTANNFYQQAARAPSQLEVENFNVRYRLMFATQEENKAI